jgi:ABC-2 type transport system ATP-binding protein
MMPNPLTRAAPTGSTADAAASEIWAVSTTRLSKRYGHELALESVDLRIPEGSVYALLGTNGSGKSTALKVLLNLETPDSGSAAVFGFDTVRAGPTVRAQIGYVPERHDAGYRWMTCRRFLEHLAKYYPTWDTKYVAHLTTALELRVDRKISGLSKGEARRLQLILALAHRPPLLLLDEPTDGLDPIVRRRALELLAEHLADTPTTLVISTHQIYEIESLADHIGVLQKGRLVAQLSRQELQRTVRSYRMNVPDGWTAPNQLAIASKRRPLAGRQLQWIIIGEERETTEHLILSGAEVLDVTALPLEDAALALLARDRVR